MPLQIACLRGCIITLVAFVWLFSSVYSKVRLEIAFVRRYMNVYSHWLQLINLLTWPVFVTLIGDFLSTPVWLRLWFSRFWSIISIKQVRECMLDLYNTDIPKVLIILKTIFFKLKEKSVSEILEMLSWWCWSQCYYNDAEDDNDDNDDNESSESSVQSLSMSNDSKSLWQ